MLSHANKRNSGHLKRHFSLLVLVVVFSLSLTSMGDKMSIAPSEATAVVMTSLIDSKIKDSEITQELNSKKYLLNQTGQLWAPYVEWSYENPTYSGNPFDLVASATFTHQASGEKRTTGLFYDKGNIWKLRFAGTRTGEWTFITTSADPNLNGLSGTVNIDPNPSRYGFVTNVGNKWARQINENGGIEPFVPNFKMFPELPSVYNDPAFIDAYLSQFFDKHGFNGFHTFMAAAWVDYEIESGRFTDTSRRDPDPRSFEALERLISKTHAAGGVVHIWYMGDCSRSQCAQAGFGSNGARSKEEQRLLRYIAARLGPLPGWIMSYGYDNPEHVTTTDLRQWGNYLRSHLGWRHYLSARDQSWSESYSFWPEADFYSKGEGPQGWTYDKVVQTLDSDINKPWSFDERAWDTRLNQDEQRRYLWTWTMAGGASGIWHWQWDTEPFSRDYPNQEQLKTYSTFWKGRFLLNMIRANNLTNGWVLKLPTHTHYVFYKEGTNSIQMNLTGMFGPQPAVAVDTKLAYAEIELGMLSPTNQTWNAPYASDWAIAVGDFSNIPSDTTPPTVVLVGFNQSEPTQLMVIFSEPVTEGSATNIANYSIDKGITISSASLGANRRIVTLTTSPHLKGTNYTLTINNVRDRASPPNTIAANSQVTYTSLKQLFFPVILRNWLISIGLVIILVFSAWFFWLRHFP